MEHEYLGTHRGEEAWEARCSCGWSKTVESEALGQFAWTRHADAAL